MVLSPLSALKRRGSANLQENRLTRHSGTGKGQPPVFVVSALPPEAASIRYHISPKSARIVQSKFLQAQPLIFSAPRATIICSFILCKNDDADKPKSRSPCRREGCRPEGRAASSLPCAGLSTTAECRGELLPGAPVTAQRVACSSTQFGWNRGTQLDLSKALHPVEQMRGEASFLLYQTHFSCQEGVTP